MRFADDVHKTADDVQLVQLSVEQARKLIGSGETTEELDTALDGAQGEVFMGNTTAAYVLIAIVP